MWLRAPLGGRWVYLVVILILTWRAQLVAHLGSNVCDVHARGAGQLPRENVSSLRSHRVVILLGNRRKIVTRREFPFSEATSKNPINLASIVGWSGGALINVSAPVNVVRCTSAFRLVCHLLGGLSFSARTTFT